MRTTAILLTLVLAAVALPGCSSSHTAAKGLVYVAMDTTAGAILLELDRSHAPISVDNFLAHARAGDYDGTIFHRVVPQFVIQGGGFTPDLKDRGKLAEAAGHQDKPIHNEWGNGLKNERGTIAMARDTQPDTATREFYINVVDNPKLDTPREVSGSAGYAVFGRVIQGMSVVDAIRNGRTMAHPEVIVDGEGMKDVPVEPVIITSVRQVSAPVRAPTAATIPPPPPPTSVGQGAYR